MRQFINQLRMTELGMKSRKLVQIELLKNADVKYQALIDISDNSFMRLNEEFKYLIDYIETLSSISYQMGNLSEVCIECNGKESLAHWVATIDYWIKECQSEIKAWNKNAVSALK